MIINAKCTFDDCKQIEDRVINKGNKNLEIQIIKDIDYLTDEEIKGRIEKYNLNINVVHLKFSKGKATNLINIINNKDVYIKDIYSGFEFAEKCAIFQNKEKVGVVIHGDLTLEHFLYLMRNKLFLSRMKELLDNFPHTEILIENVMFARDFEQLNGITGRGGSLFEPVDFVKILNKEFKTDRFKSLLDICHALSTVEIVNTLFNKNLSLEDFFKTYKKNIGLIHLSHCNGYGFKEDHGLPFTIEDILKLKDILQLYRKYEYDCPITIEVDEKDYYDAKNYQETYNNLLSLVEPSPCENSSLFVEYIIVNNSVIEKIKIDTCLDFFEIMKNRDIMCTTIFIKRYPYLKFHTKNGIIIVPKGAYVFFNTSTKKFTVGYDANFDVLDIPDKIVSKKLSLR